MDDNGDDKKLPPRESLDQLMPESSVREFKTETEAVAVQRLKNEAAKDAADHSKYMRIVTLCTVIAMSILGFLAYVFFAGGINEDAKKFILAAFGAGLTGVIGVAVGKKV